MINYEIFKPRLLEYLHRKGYRVKLGSDFCFNPTHENTNTPAAKYTEDHFHCFAGHCGINGDIYDAVEILEGITNKKKQYEFLEDFLGSGYVPPATPAKKSKENFIADIEAQNKFEDYLKSNPKGKSEILKFLSLRAAYLSSGRVDAYPADLIEDMVKHFMYWPGLEKAEKELGRETLKKAGIPLRNPKTKIAFWESPGIVVKMGINYKLRYYKDGESKKYNSFGRNTFFRFSAINRTKPVTVVEGEMDAIAVIAAGAENVFSCGGTNGLTGPKIKELLLDVPEIIIMFDPDMPGRKAAGLMPYEPQDKRQTNVPEIILQTGYKGKIKIAELPVVENEKDPDELVLMGKKDLIFKAVKEAKEYVPPEKKAENKTDAKYDFLTLKRIQALLKKMPRTDLDTEDVQTFVTAVLKAGKNKKDIESELTKWGAKKEEIKNENETTPYALVELAWGYGLSRYIQKTLEIELTPASEFLKKIKWHKPKVDIDYSTIKENENLKQFMTTKGVRSAALFVADVLDGNIIYSESEGKFYFFNGHVWLHESDMTGVAFNIVSAVMYYFLKMEEYPKQEINEVIHKIESRSFRLDIVKEFSQLEDGVWKKSVNFDSPTIKETLTLMDGVLDFTGKEIIFRKAKKEEFRRHILPYKIEDFKNTKPPAEFKKFMHSNFKNPDTLETLMYFLSLIPSRNTQFKVGGFFIGDTNTGKTTTITIMQAIFPEMIPVIPSSILVNKGDRFSDDKGPNPHLAQLEGMGAGVANETKRGAYLNNALFKDYTGGGAITTRNLYEKPHTFIPTAQLIMTTNDPPSFDSHDTATIERMVIIPFMIQHKKEKEANIQPDEFIDKFRHEFPSIISLFAEYYIRLKTEHNRLIPLSDECKRYKAQYVDDQDTDLDKFVKENIQFTLSEDVTCYEKVKDVYHRYLKYYGFVDDFGLPDEKAKEALTQHKITRYLKKDYRKWGLDYKQIKIEGKPTLVFLNIKLKDWDEKAHEQKPDNGKSGGNAPPPDENPFG